MPEAEQEARRGGSDGVAGLGGGAGGEDKKPESRGEAAQVSSA